MLVLLLKWANVGSSLGALSRALAERQGSGFWPYLCCVAVDRRAYLYPFLAQGSPSLKPQSRGCPIPLGQCVHPSCLQRVHQFSSCLAENPVVWCQWHFPSEKGNEVIERVTGKGKWVGPHLRQPHVPHPTPGMLGPSPGAGDQTQKCHTSYNMGEYCLLQLWFPSRAGPPPTESASCAHSPKPGHIGRWGSQEAPGSH